MGTGLAEVAALTFKDSFQTSASYDLLSDTIADLDYRHSIALLGELASTSLCYIVVMQSNSAVTVMYWIVW